MAETKTKVTELPKKDLSRVFNRIDTIKWIPKDIYGSYGVEEGDMAVFNVTPANPSVRDSLKQVVLTMSTMLNTLCEDNGITPQDLGTLNKAKGKKRNAILKTLSENNAFARYEMTSTGTRSLLAKCVKIENYKVLDGDKLVPSNMSTEDIMQVIPDVFVEALFEKIQELSNLTAQEVLGV